jgi:hypothetical protein
MGPDNRDRIGKAERRCKESGEDHQSHVRDGRGTMRFVRCAGSGDGVALERTEVGAAWWWWWWKCDLRRASGEGRLRSAFARSGPAVDDTFARGKPSPGGYTGAGAAAAAEGGVRSGEDDGDASVTSESESESCARSGQVCSSSEEEGETAAGEEAGAGAARIDSSSGVAGRAAARWRTDLVGCTSGWRSAQSGRSSASETPSWNARTSRNSRSTRPTSAGENTCVHAAQCTFRSVLSFAYLAAHTSAPRNTRSHAHASSAMCRCGSARRTYASATSTVAIGTSEFASTRETKSVKAGSVRWVARPREDDGPGRAKAWSTASETT